MASPSFRFGADHSPATQTAARSPFQSPTVRGGLKWEAHVSTARRAAQHSLSALLQHQRRWEAYTTESARTLQCLANARTEHEYVACQPPDALGAHMILSSKLVEASARECERQMSKLDDQLARLLDANEGMQGAARTARAAIATATGVLGDEWARSDTLLRTASGDRLCALADVIAREHANEFELKAAIVSDLRRVGCTCAPSEAVERNRMRKLYLASWIMQPGRSGLGDESAEHCVRALTAELL